MSQISNAQRIAKNTGFLFIRMILVLFVSLYTSRVILKTLGVDDFALYNVVGSVVVFFSFLQTALNNATYRFLAYELGRGESEHLNQIYSMAINAHVLLAILVFIVLEIGGVWFVNNHLNIDPDRIHAANWAFQFSLLTFCFNIIRTPYNSNIIAHERMDFYAIVSIIEVLLKLGIVYLLVLSPFDKLVSYSALLSIVALIVWMLYIVYCKKVFKDCYYIRFWDSSILKSFTSYSGWSLLVNVADVSTAQCLSIFFFNILGTIANASLGIANQVVGALNAFLHTFTQAFNPQIIKTYAAEKYDAFLRLLFSTSKVSYLLLLLLTIPVISNINYILSIWLGDYPAYTPSYVIVIIALSLIDAFQAPLWQAVHATGKIKTHQIMMSSIKILTIPLVYIALRLGYNGVVALLIWTTLNLVCAIVRTLYLQVLIHFDVSSYLKDVVVRIMVVSVLSIPFPLLISRSISNAFIAFLLSSLIGVLLVIGLGYFFALNNDERQLLRTMPFIKHLLIKNNEE